MEYFNTDESFGDDTYIFYFYFTTWHRIASIPLDTLFVLRVNKTDLTDFWITKYSHIILILILFILCSNNHKKRTKLMKESIFY